MEKDPVIAIVMATMLEAKPFVLGMSLQQTRKVPFRLFQKDKTLLIISGIGKANGAMAVTYGCLKFKPACICNLGAAGTTHEDHSLGDIFHIQKIVEHDRPDLESRESYIHTTDLLKGFDTATLATSDRAILAPAERNEMFKVADLLDMEGASVAQACKKFKTKCFMFKFVSDTPEHTKDEDIVANIRLNRSYFYEYFKRSVMPHLV